MSRTRRAALKLITLDAGRSCFPELGLIALHQSAPESHVRTSEAAARHAQQQSQLHKAAKESTVSHQGNVLTHSVCSGEK